MKVFLFLIACLLCYESSSAQSAKTNAVCVLFESCVGDSLLQLGSTYQNHFGEAFSVRSFKYYVSHFVLIDENGKTISVDAKPHLVNEADSTSKMLTFGRAFGKIQAVEFLLGIDSTTNTNGVQTGDLDPARGMFWVWNTGYIMAKLEGRSSNSKAPGKQFSYDIGGFKKGENAARLIRLSLPSSTNLSTQDTLIITADIDKWFWGKNNVKISEQPMCHEPGKLAMQVADNYADMFRIRFAK